MAALRPEQIDKPDEVSLVASLALANFRGESSLTT
jgi:hypothetical protein